MIILDTNILSEAPKPEPNLRVLNWLRDVGEATVITAVTLGEISYGVHRLRDGRRRRNLEAFLGEVVATFAGRVLPFDAAAAFAYGEIRGAATTKGFSVSEPDAQIAGIAKSRGLPLATRNVRDFGVTGLRLINPWEEQ